MHNYVKKLDKMIADGSINITGISTARIAHDGWCAINKGGECNCDPDITITAGEILNSGGRR